MHNALCVSGSAWKGYNLPAAIWQYEGKSDSAVLGLCDTSAETDVPLKFELQGVLPTQNFLNARER